ncbi:MAG: hypothetical protein P8Y93_10260 [Acidobacteriota bacterium]
MPVILMSSPRVSRMRTGTPSLKAGGLARVEDGRRLLDLELDGCRSLARGAGCVGDDRDNRLAHEVNLAVGEQRLVLDDATDLVRAGDVRCCEHACDTLQRGCGRGVESDHAAMGNGRGEKGCVEEPVGRRDVGDEKALAAGVRSDLPVAHDTASAIRPSSRLKSTWKCARTSWPSSSLL